MADAVYLRLLSGPISAADMVGEIRNRWGADFGFLEVHGFIREVATDLLHYDDVEVGDFEGGQFVSWGLEPWDSDSKIDDDMMSMSTFLEDKTRYVFRRKIGG